MFKKTNKKGFTLIELIIVVAIMAVLVALLAPNVMKYLEKSKFGKDQNTLDGIRLTIEAEITDEELYDLATDADLTDGLKGIKLADIQAAMGQDTQLGKLADRLFGANKGIETSLTEAGALESKVGKTATIVVFLNGNGGVAVAAVVTGEDSNGAATYDVAEYEGKKLEITTKLDGVTLDYALA